MSEDDTVLSVDVFRLNVTSNGVGLGISSPGYLEVDIVWSGSLFFFGAGVEGG